MEAKTLGARCWAKVRRTDGCWLWTGATNSQGYPVLSIDGRLFYVHRVVCDIWEGLPDDHEPDHLCRVRRCIRPEHLEAVTHQENCARGARLQDYSQRRWRTTTHCPQGHERDSSERGRGCRACGRDRKREYRRKKWVARVGM